jgi:acetyl-CoA carboxylase biotin carboxyl carrier protein
MPRDAAPGGPFDLDSIQKLVELMDKHELSEVKLQKGNERVILRRGPAAEECGHMYPMPMGMPMMPPQPQAFAPAAAPTPASAPAAPPAAPAAEENLPSIKSPTVGTFYSSPQPGEPAFVKAGDRVKPDSVVCIIEAMKVFNQIPAKASGTIVRCLVKDGDAIEYNQPLFLIKE